MCCCIRAVMEASHKPRQGEDCPRTGASSSSTTSSETSERSKSTAPTIYSDHRPTSKRNEPVIVDSHEHSNHDDDAVGPRDSVSTYASTVPSIDEITTEEPGPLYEVFDRRLEFFPTDALPSNPHTFGDLFPSSRRLRIRHDDATLDGNMNLRVDTVVPHRAGHQQDVTLFHLRMYDLFSRRFSFRRYCRDSGREVFHSERKQHSSFSSSTAHGLEKKLGRSWSTALASLRPGSSNANGQSGRRDSGSRPAANEEGVFLDDEELDSQDNNDRQPVGFTDTTMLEFSNYAHVEVNRRGAGIAKRYDYEYWSTRYQWRRECRREGDLREVSYHLFNTQSSKPIAHLVPDILTPSEAIEEEDKGGWIPPSSMWISDSSVYEKMPDVAE